MKTNYTAFNPIVVDVLQVSTEKEASLTIYVLSCIDSNYKEVLVITRAFNEGAASFDISNVVSRLFSDTRRELTSGTLIGYTTNKLFVDLLYRGSDNSTERIAIYNAVNQFNRDDIFNAAQKFLMLRNNYTVYDGYPFDLTVCNPSVMPPVYFNDDYNDDFVRSIGPAPLSTENGVGDLIVYVNDLHAVVEGGVGVICVSSDMNYGEASTASISGYDSEIILRVSESGDANFYIRWINQIGGYEFKMFQVRNVAEQRIKDVAIIQTEHKQSVLETITQETLGLNASNVIITGDSNLDRENFLWLQGIASSPEICHWDKPSQKWINIAILDSDTQSWDSDSGLGSVEFTFLLPRILKQF